MKKISRWISRKFIKNYQRVNDLKVRAQYGALEGWASIIINILLFIIKILVGLSIKSVSLIADAIHTLADSATSVVVIIGFKIAKKPSDKEHPFGHGRMESVATLIVSVLLFIAGVELIEKSIHSIVHPQAAIASLGIISLIIVTIIIKELMARFSYELGDIIDSEALRADALHHRSDVIATSLVVIALIASYFGYNRIDGIMGLFVSLIIFYSAYSIAKEAINPLLGQAVSPQTLRKIEVIAKNHSGVLGVHDIIFNQYGSASIISLHIEVSDKETVNKLHMLSEEVEQDLAQQIGGTVIVHVDPINKNHPQYVAIARTVQEIIAQDKRVHSFHELRIIGAHTDKCNVVFDIALSQDADEQETHDIIYSIQEKFKARFPEMKVFIKAEPRFAYNL